MARHSTQERRAIAVFPGAGAFLLLVAITQEVLLVLLRTLTRVAAAGLLAAAGLAIAATPALAADVDLGVKLSGTTIALEAPEKPATVDVTNLGTTKPVAVRVVFDLTDVDPRVGIDEEDCTTAARIVTCTMEDAAVPGPGQTARLTVLLTVTGTGARGDQGRLTVTVTAEDDADTGNNSASAGVTLSEQSGPDLWVTAFDIDKPGESKAPIQPGEKAATWGVIVNNGDVDATDIRLAIKLPPQVTFVTEEEGCEYDKAKTEAECTLGDAILIPSSTSNEDPTGDRVVEPEFEVRLSADAEGPKTVSGGTWTVIGEAAPATLRSNRAAAAVLPSWAKAITAEELEDLDVDPSDNTDTFAVLIAGPGAGNGGGNGGGDGDDDPTLPITGSVAGPAAGIGATFVGIGVLLLFAARRRRIEGGH